MEKTVLFRSIFLFGLLNIVTGLSLTFNRNNVVIGDSTTSNLVFTMTCSINEENDLHHLTSLRILMNNTTPPQALAIINPFEVDGNSTLKPGTSWSSRATVGGSYDSSNPRSTQLTLSINASLLACADGETYICEISYLDQDSAPKSESDAETLAVIEQPKPSIQFSAQNMSAGGAQISGVGTESNPAVFMEGQMVKLTCTGQIGSNADALIVWRKTNYASGQLQDYSPGLEMQDDGTAGNLQNCQYTRTAWVQYNMTSADMSRPANSPLIFDCFIRDSRTSYTTPEGDRPKFYVRVYNSNPYRTDESTDNGGASNAGVIAGSVIGAIVFIVIVVLLLYFLWYRRRSEGDDYTTKEEQGASNPNLAPTYAVPDKSGYSGYDNNAIDEPRETRSHKHDRGHDRGHERGRDRDRNGRGGRANYGMERDEDYHSRDGSPTTDHVNHMGMDPIDGSIGTGV